MIKDDIVRNIETYITQLEGLEKSTCIDGNIMFIINSYALMLASLLSPKYAKEINYSETISKDNTPQERAYNMKISLINILKDYSTHNN